MADGPPGETTTLHFPLAPTSLSVTQVANLINVLIIGVGSIGERHLRCFQATGRASVSLCELNPALRDRISSQYVVDHNYDSLEAALEARPQAAVVATPAHLHVPMAHRLAQGGIDFLLEKPLSTSCEGVAALMTLVEEKDVIASVAYVYRAHPALKAMREALLSGRFGRPLQLAAVCGSHFPTYRPAYRDTYYRDHATGGGAIQDALTHFLNAGEWLVGPIDRLVVDAGHQKLDGVDVEDTVHLLARQGNVLSSYTLNQHQAPIESAITVVCESGTVRFEMTENRWRWMIEPGSAWHDEPADAPSRDSLFINQANSFLDAVERKERPACSLAEGLQTLRCNLAALESWRQLAWQTIDLPR